MITYPSTHGVFETQVKELCELVHAHGGRVYVDGANMNALVGVAAPGEFGGDVSHLNLHKTFCIPHGGGGPGVGPVCVVEDLVPYPAGPCGRRHGRRTAVGRRLGRAAGQCGRAADQLDVLPHDGRRTACRPRPRSRSCSANYISARLKDHYPTLYASPNGHVAHECILDLRPLKDTSGVTAEDVAKRLIDYGFHAPTLSFPVPGTLMVEPTESETLAELDRFIDAMIAIRDEIRRIEEGDWPQDDNPLKHAPHTAASLLTAEWTRPYSRELGAFPLAELKHAESTGRRSAGSTTSTATATCSAAACRSGTTPRRESAPPGAHRAVTGYGLATCARNSRNFTLRRRSLTGPTRTMIFWPADSASSRGSANS